MKLFSYIIGMIVCFLTVIVLVTIGNETPYEIYTTNRFTNFLEIFLILEIGAISTETVIDSTAREVAIDTLVVFVVAAITNYVYFEYNIILFYPNNVSRTIASRLLVPATITNLFASYGREKISESFRKKED